MNKVNYYKVLGVDPAVSDDELHKAFKVLFARYNPSSNPNSAYLRTMYQQLNQAYEILGDKTKRIEYNVEQGFQKPVESVVEESIYKESSVKQSNSKERIQPTLQRTNNDLYIGDSNNKAYVFLFVIIGIIIVGGGAFAYFAFNSDISLEEKVDTQSDVITPEKESNIAEVDIVNTKETTEVIPVEAPVKPVIESLKKSEENETLPVVKQEKKDLTPVIAKQENKDKSPKVPPSDKTVAASKTNDLKDEFGTKRSFNVGATKNDVWAVKGDPTDVKIEGDIEIWYYGKVKVKFKNGKVIN
ncbi:DnaJ domain-containing protein [Myroides sp. M-43]|uniref:DnaJ domain-containing protein n=1 Tax=Myroides oncorhynchi TaxID=2893756 RepID=UPI001E4E47B4|nr:DnaJ domain-containing protein [Myroides oncorhynchi]MCC9043441.1 DnaJ domain-containing protein [Myroides oncorhynchi]